MIPLHDDNPTRSIPVVTIGIIAANLLVFFWQIGLSESGQRQVLYALGLVPAVLFGERSLPAAVALVPAPITVVTSMFLHGGWIHLLGNMLYLWIFGNNVEDSMGRFRFVAFYLACGTAAALAQVSQDPGSTVPMVGASGAIGGVLGAYLILHPRARVLMLIPIFFFVIFRRIPAVFVLGIWFVLQFLATASVRPGAEGGVAYWAHIGGFMAGVALIFVFRRKDVVLLDRNRPSSRAAPNMGPWGRRR